MTFEMSTTHFNDTLESVLALSFCGIVLAATWIIIILVQIEASKVSFFSVDTDQNTLDLSLEESSTNKDGMEVEQTASSFGREPEIKLSKGRRVPFSFKMMQVGSVLILILMVYLLLVASNAPIWLSALGSISVFGMFLRFQIGDEIRRQRWDRLTLMMSLFLLIAAFLNLSTYAWKSLKQGEIYMGPARIVGYDMSPYNNSNLHDPTTRTDVMVQWGKDWGCPYTGGKLCQAHVEGVMCAIKTEGTRKLLTSSGNSTLNNSTASGNATHTGWSAHGADNATDGLLEKENESLETENEGLEKENEELKEEIDALKEKSDEEVDEAIDEELFVEDEMIGEEYEDAKEVVDADMEKEEAEADVDEMEEEMDQQDLENELATATDDAVKDELDKDMDMLDQEIEETENKLDSDLDEEEDLADEYEDVADEFYDEADEELDAAIDEMYDEEETEEVIDEIEDTLDGEETSADDWYWEEMNLDYDDDNYDAEYWNYDWDSAWGEQSCSDLFDTDIAGQTYDANKPAGGDDDWPYINIYGSCKTCDAYIMDYFAEQAFEKLDDYFLQAVMYLCLAFSGMSVSLIGFIKYKLAPPAENQIELLGSDGGVMA